MDFITSQIRRATNTINYSLGSEYWATRVDAPLAQAMLTCHMDIQGNNLVVACDPYVYLINATTGVVRDAQQYEGLAGAMTGLVEAACVGIDGRIFTAGLNTGLMKCSPANPTVGRAHRKTAGTTGTLFRGALVRLNTNNILSKNFFISGTNINILSAVDKDSLATLWSRTFTTAMSNAGVKPCVLTNGNILSIDNVANTGGFASAASHVLDQAGTSLYNFRFYRVQTSAEVARCSCAIPNGGYAACFYSSAVSQPVLYTCNSASALVANRRMAIPDVKKIVADSTGAVYCLSVDATNAVTLCKLTADLATMTWRRNLGIVATLWDMVIQNDILFIALATATQLIVLKLPIDGTKTGTYTSGGFTFTYGTLAAVSTSSGGVIRTTSTAMSADTPVDLTIPAGGLGMRTVKNYLKAKL